MTKEQVAFLMKQGFSVDEIMVLSQPREEPKPASQKDPPTPEEPKPAQDMSAKIAALTGAVDNLTKLVQRGNIGGISFGTPPQDRTADDILAEIINPPKKK